MILFIVAFAIALWCLAWIITKLSRDPNAGTAEDDQPVR